MHTQTAETKAGTRMARARLSKMECGAHVLRVDGKPVRVLIPAVLDTEPFRSRVRYELFLTCAPHRVWRFANVWGEPGMTVAEIEVRS